MKKIIIVGILLYAHQVICQENDLSRISLSLGYFGETITHAGATLGIEFYPHQTDRYKMILAANVGGYVHVRNNASLFVRAQWGQSIHFRSGVFLEQFLGLGYLHQFIHGGELYEVLPNGAVVEKSNGGESKMMPSIGLGFGYHFKSPRLSKFSIYIRPELFWKAPFNGYYLTHFALNTGVIINLRKK